MLAPCDDLRNVIRHACRNDSVSAQAQNSLSESVTIRPVTATSRDGGIARGNGMIADRARLNGCNRRHAAGSV